MSDLVIAEFDTQFAASSALDKLLSRGMRRDDAVVCCSESIGDSPASSSAPTTVVSRFSHHAMSRSEVRSPAADRNPSLVGHATLTVELADRVPLEDVMRVMRQAGASGVHVVVDQPFDRDDPHLSPIVDYGSPADVAHAIEASR
jgi:hypothetical protein